MAIFAILTGGVVGWLTAAIAVFGIGVTWSTGAIIYFSTVAIIASPLVTLGYRRAPVEEEDTSRFEEWERELRGFQDVGEFAPIQQPADGPGKVRRSA